MSSPRSRRVLQELGGDKANTRCFECGAYNPQWASVSLAIWICLECSGKHRSIGVHLSFVRSLTMDKWKESELEKMKVGGNRHAREFLESQDDWDATRHISLKYNCRAAALLRDKIKTESEGRVWNISESSAASGGVGLIHKSASSPNTHSLAASGGATNHATNHAANYTGSHHSASYAQEETGGYQQGYTDAKQAFFQRKQMENSMRPEHLSPSQGGRYSGFGNTVTPAPRAANSDVMETAMQSLTNGWSLLSMGATKMARSATDSALKLSSTASDLSSTVSEKFREGRLGEEFLSQAQQVTDKMGDLSRRGLSHVNTWVSGSSAAIGYNNTDRLQYLQQESPAVERSTLLAPSTGRNGKLSSSAASTGGAGSGGGYQCISNDDWRSRDRGDEWGSGVAWQDTHLTAPLTAAARSRGASTDGAAKTTKRSPPPPAGTTATLIDLHDNTPKSADRAKSSADSWEDEAWASLCNK